MRFILLLRLFVFNSHLLKCKGKNLFLLLFMLYMTLILLMNLSHILCSLIPNHQLLMLLKSLYIWQPCATSAGLIKGVPMKPKVAHLILRTHKKVRMCYSIVQIAAGLKVNLLLTKKKILMNEIKVIRVEAMGICSYEGRSYLLLLLRLLPIN